MKTLWIFSLALTLGFLAPLAQASPPEMQPNPVPAAAPAPVAPPSDPTAPPAGQHDPDCTPHTGPDDSRHPWSDQNANPPSPNQDTSPAAVSYDPGLDQATADSSCESEASASAQPAHYSMDDLANAAADLDASY